MQITNHSDNNKDTAKLNGSHTHKPKTEHIKTDELLRLLLQSLYDLGYHNVAKTLERDSGVALETPIVAEFREAVLAGDWNKCESLFPQLCLAPQEQEQQDIQFNHIKFLIRQQKFLELLESRKLMKALSVLRNELSPLGEQHTERLHELSSLILCSSVEEVKQRIQWDGVEGFSREQLLVQLQRYIDPSRMLPRDRLLTLINQAFEWQRSNCLYHNRNKATFSLFSDHICDKAQFPTKTIAVLEDHTDEVWHVAYSPSGRYLASASKDASCIIWDVYTYQRVKRLRCASSVSYCCWSPDESRVAICGNDSLLLIWDPFEGQILQNFVGHSDQVTSCVWLPDGQHIISGSCDKSLRLWNINGDLIKELDDQRITDMALSANGSRLVVTGFDKNIFVYDVDGLILTKISDIQEEGFITSLALTKDGRYALVNMQETQEIHLWDLEMQEIVRKYQGLKQGVFIIRSAFGGDDGFEHFILSGSEDDNVYVWSRSHQTLLQVLEGHQKTVNSVAWCPRSSQSPTFASASDDHTIRIWGLDRDQLPTRQHTEENGTSYRNTETESDTT